MAEDSEDEEGSIIVVVPPLKPLKRVKEYIYKAFRPNVHLGMYYSRIDNEYGPPRLLNIIAEEKYYK